VPRIPCGLRQIALCVVLLAIGVTRSAMAETLNDIGQKLPSAIGGFKIAGAPVLRTPANLSDYIDGGAELYLSYNFKNALSQKYKGPNADEISVDIFDMGSSFDAFGVFAHSRETLDASVGQGSEYAAGLLTFWKDRYYVSILAYPETPAKKETVFTLGRTIAGAIPRTGALPPVLALLPRKGLSPESVRYFHHYIWLNSFHFVSNDNVLEIAHDTPAALGTYKKGGASVFLLVVRYPTAARAAAASGRFRKDILGGAPNDVRETKGTKGSRWTGLQLRHDVVAVVLNAQSAEAVREMFAKLGN
jgi:Family of unknown function (DUF6599)